MAGVFYGQKTATNELTKAAAVDTIMFNSGKGHYCSEALEQRRTVKNRIND
jgi:hypothetical protein